MVKHLSRRPWVLALAALVSSVAFAASPDNSKHVSEATLVLPDLSSVQFAGQNGKALLSVGLLVCVLGMAFGLAIYRQLKNMQVHRSMREISELIYETCKTYLETQGRFIFKIRRIITARHFTPRV